MKLTNKTAKKLAEAVRKSKERAVRKILKVKKVKEKWTCKACARAIQIGEYCLQVQETWANVCDKCARKMLGRALYRLRSLPVKKNNMVVSLANTKVGGGEYS